MLAPSTHGWSNGKSQKEINVTPRIGLHRPQESHDQKWIPDNASHFRNDGRVCFRDDGRIDFRGYDMNSQVCVPPTVNESIRNVG